MQRVDACDQGALHDCLRAVRPAAVVNAVKSWPSRERPLSAVFDNVIAAANLLVSAADSGCARFVQLGSSTEYEARRGRLDESTPLQPTSVHGATKAAASQICHALASELGVRLVVLRPFQVYGPWDSPAHLVPAAIAAALDDRELVLAPRGRRDWVYIADVIEACLLSLDAELGGEDLNLGSGRQWRNEEVVETIGRLSGRRIRVRLDEQAARPSGPRRLAGRLLEGRRAPRLEAAPRPRERARSDDRLGARTTEPAGCNRERRRGASERMTSSGQMSLVSVVVPVYRNAATLRELHARLGDALPELDRRELIFVNDGCDDGSGVVLGELAQADRTVVVVELEANRGQHTAVLAGLERSRGEWTVVLDADLQDPPEAIPALLAAAAAETDAVFAGRRGGYSPGRASSAGGFAGACCIWCPAPRSTPARMWRSAAAWSLGCSS